MANLPPIRTPLVQHIRRIRTQMLPVIIFVTCVAMTTWLWRQQVGVPRGIGEVNAISADAVSVADGTLVQATAKPLELFETVQQGQVIARLDNQQAIATLAQMQNSLTQLRASFETNVLALGQNILARNQSGQADAASMAVTIERLRLTMVEQQGIIESSKANLHNFTEMYNMIKALVDKGLESELNLKKVETDRDSAAQRLDAAQKTLAEAELQKASAEKRLRELSQPPSEEVEILMKPTREAIAAEEKRIQEVRRQLESLDIVAPIMGTITAIHRWPGQNVTAGTPIVTIAAREGQYIVSYVREVQRIRPVVGMTADVRLRSLPRQSVIAVVEQVGPQVELVPLHHLRDPKTPEWGLPVKIALPPSLQLRPGELVDVALKPSPAPATR